jgi:hypothetical protein
MRHELKKVSVSKLSPFDFGKFFYEDALNEGKPDARAQFETFSKCREKYRDTIEQERCKNAVLAVRQKKFQKRYQEREEA